MPVYQKGSAFDFRSFLPDFVQSGLKSATESVKEFASHYPEPVKKAAKFGFEALYPTEPIDEITSLMHPLGAALNLPKKILKEAGEELMDTLPRYLPNRRIQEPVKDVLQKHKGLLGYLGGEGQVVDNADPSALGYFMQSPTASAFYSPMFDNSVDVDNFKRAVEQFQIRDLPDLKIALQGARGVGSWGYPRKAVNINTWDLPANAAAEGMSEKDFLKMILEHELTHAGQDVAPKGAMRAFGDINPDHSKLMYQTLSPEILIHASRRNNPYITKGMKIQERLNEAIDAQGVNRVFNSPLVPQDIKDYFISDILPILQRYGR